MQMFLRFWLGLLLGAVFLTSPLKAQDKPVYRLLWEVTSPNSERPSYLFGTMHDTDENIFNLPDSVMLGIDACDGFATEVAFDEALNSFMGLMISGGVEVNESRSKSGLMERLEELLGGDGAGSSPDPMRLFQNLGEEYEAGEDRETFLDAFLYRVARDDGKVVGGLEKIEDQISLLIGDNEDVFRDGPPNSLSRLKTAYISGDLDAIEEFINLPEVSQAFRDEVLTKRNYVMAHSADSLIRLRPTFVAVGAAHLPGEEGLIQLMRDRRYRLRAVKATYTGVVEDYLDRPYNPHWITYEDEDYGMRVEVPVKPFKVDIVGDELAMQFGMDLPAGFFYAFYRFQLPGLTEEYMQNLMFKTVVDEMGLDSEEGVVEVEQGNLKGKEVIGPVADYTFRVRILFDEESMIFLMTGMSEQTVRGAISERFLGSVETFQPDPIFNRPFEVQQFPRHGFQVALPGVPDIEYDSTIVEDDPLWQIRFCDYEVSDPYYTQNILVQTIDLAPMNYVEDDTSYFETLIEGFEEEEMVVGERQRVTRNGIAGWEIPLEYEGDSLLLRHFSRGDRHFNVYFSTASDDSAMALSETFLNSFEYLPYPPIAMGDTFQRPGFTARFPTPPGKTEGWWEFVIYDGLDEVTHYAARDTISATGFAISRYDLSPYLRVDSVRQFIEEWIQVEDSTNTLISFPGEVKPDLKGPRFPMTSTQLKNGRLRTTKRIFSGQRIWELTVSTVPGMQNDPMIKAFLEESELELVGNLEDLKKGKADLLMAGLVSTDSAEAAQAREAFGEYVPLPEERELFMEYFAKVDPSLAGVRGELGKIVAGLQTEASRRLLKQVYPQLDSARFQLDILGALLKTEAPEERKLALQFMNQALPAGLEYYQLIDFILEARADNLDQILAVDFMAPILKDPHYLTALIDHLAAEVQEDEIEPESLKEVLDQVRGVLDGQLDENTMFTKPDGYYSLPLAFVSWFRMAGDLPFTPEEERFVRKALAEGELKTRALAAEALIKRDLEVSSKSLKEICGDPRQGFRMTKKLIDLEKGKMVPNKCRKQPQLAEQMLWWDLEEYSWYYEQGKAVRMKFIDREEAFWDGEEVYLYTFQVAFEGDPDWYLGFAGPFGREKNALPVNNALTGLAEDSYSPGRYETQVRRYVRRIRSENGQ